MFRNLSKSCLGVVLLLMILVVAGCAKIPSSSKDPIYILDRGNYYYTKGNYMEAEKMYQRVLNEFPDSPYRADALMGLGDSLFYQEDYDRAALSYVDFYNLYPTHPNVINAYFYKGMSSFNERKTFDRDQTNAIKAIEDFENITKSGRFQQGIFYGEASKNIEVCKRLLAQHIFHVGKYYFKTGSYGSTITRMEQLIMEYPNESYQDEAVFLIAESYFLKDNTKMAIEYYKRLSREYPNSPLAATANKRIAEIEDRTNRLISKGKSG